MGKEYFHFLTITVSHVFYYESLWWRSRRAVLILTPGETKSEQIIYLFLFVLSIQ